MRRLEEFRDPHLQRTAQEDGARSAACVPPAPWSASASAVTWWQRPGRAERESIHNRLPPRLRSETQVLLTVGMMLSYRDTPVGPYREVLGMVVLRSGWKLIAHVPFIAVDSQASVIGGRVNWGLPKTLATFEGTPRNATRMRASSPAWTIEVTPRVLGPALPLLLPPVCELVQPGPEGALIAARTFAIGTGRLARVTVESDLGDWLPAGRFTGMLSERVLGSLPPTHAFNARRTDR